MNRIDVLNYLQNHNLDETCTHFHCSFKELFQLMETNMPRPNNPVNPTGEKYIYRGTYGLQIRKSIDGKFVSFGHYTTLKEAIKMRDELIENNWELVE